MIQSTDCPNTLELVTGRLVEWNWISFLFSRTKENKINVEGSKTAHLGESSYQNFTILDPLPAVFYLIHPHFYIWRKRRLTLFLKPELPADELKGGCLGQRSSSEFASIYGALSLIFPVLNEIGGNYRFLEVEVKVKVKVFLS